MTAARIEKPNMWLANNDRLNLHIRRNFRMVWIGKKNGINENQPGVFKIEGDKVFSEMFVRLLTIEDRGDFWYIGYEPAGKDRGRCTFGYTRLYKEGPREFGTQAFEDATNTWDINTGARK